MLITDSYTNVVANRKMKYPEEVDIMSFFECEPTFLDSEEVPFFYNESTYSYINENSQSFTVTLCPSYSEVTFIIKDADKVISHIKLNSVDDLSILSDKREEKRLMITSENFILKMSLKPHYHLDFLEEKEN